MSDGKIVKSRKKSERRKKKWTVHKIRIKKREKRHLSLTKKERRNRCPFKSTVHDTLIWFSLAWHEWLSCKSKEWKILYCYGSGIFIRTLRAAVPKFRLEVCKMKKSKIPKLCQNLVLDERFLEKVLWASLDFYFTRTAAKSVSKLSRSLHEVQTTHHLNVAWK